MNRSPGAYASNTSSGEGVITPSNTIGCVEVIPDVMSMLPQEFEEVTLVYFPPATSRRKGRVLFMFEDSFLVGVDTIQ